MRLVSLSMLTMLALVITLPVAKQVAAQEAAASPSDELVVRTFNALPSLFRSIHDIDAAVRLDEMDEGDDASTSERLERVFGELGVAWPAGSSIKYVASLGKLVVRNSSANLDELGCVLAETGVVPFLIEISATYMLVEKAVADELSMRGALDVANIQQAWRDGKATIVANPQIVTQSGQEATMKMVEEIIYPTEFDYEASNVSADDPPASSNDVADTAEASDVTTPSAILPSAFETREVGSVLSVLPEVTPEGSMINLIMSPHYVTLAGWKDYEAVISDGNDQPVRVACPQPLFRSSQTMTSLLLKNGATMLAAVDVWHPDTESYLALLVRATLIGIDGKSLPASP